MKPPSLWVSFLLALVFTLYGTLFFPAIRLWPFSPFLVILFHQVSFSTSLWISFFCGLILDLFSSQFRFGLFALILVSTSSFLYTQKKHFFEDSAFSFSIYSAFVSAFSSFFLILFSSLDHQISFSFPLFASDLILMPLLDGLYAFLWFTCPLALITSFKKYRLKRAYSKAEDF